MKIAATILARVRGPILFAATAAGCAGPAPIADLSPEPIAAIAVAAPAAVVALDPVSYDASAERERLARADASNHWDDTRRDRRIGAIEAAARARRAAAAPQVYPQHYFLCGRG